MTRELALLHLPQILGALLLLTAAPGCGKAPAPTATTSSGATISNDAKWGCIYSEVNKRACDARGPGFRYQPQPNTICGGVHPTPEREHEEFQRIRESPCACIDIAAEAKRRDRCSQIP